MFLAARYFCFTVIFPANKKLFGAWVFIFVPVYSLGDKMHDLISFESQTKADVIKILDLSKKMDENLYAQHNLHEGKIASLMFFEPSTRTNLSFSAAAQRLGMGVLDYKKEFSSAKKGESLQDTIKIIDGYSDVIIMRHPNEGSAKMAADISKAPLINAGDGANEHPTQALIDLYTIKKAKGKLEGLNVSLVGDLKFGRTVHSLVFGLAMFGANITLVSPKGLEMDASIIERAKKAGAKISCTQKMQLENADVLYMTRLQEERFSSPAEAKKHEGSYKLNTDSLKFAKKEMIIMHPLPRMAELPAELDSSANAHYFEQAKNGVPVRMAIIHDCLTH